MKHLKRFEDVSHTYKYAFMNREGEYYVEMILGMPVFTTNVKDMTLMTEEEAENLEEEYGGETLKIRM